ncbi:hypothetical protein GCM10010400_18780 [Streptomyces aculeolatus]
METRSSTTLISAAALIIPTWPRGSPPSVCTPGEPWCSDACRAPVTVTSPAGGSGAFAGSASPGSQPRKTGTEVGVPAALSSLSSLSSLPAPSSPTGASVRRRVST